MILCSRTSRSAEREWAKRAEIGKIDLDVEVFVIKDHLVNKEVLLLSSLLLSFYFYLYLSYYWSHLSSTTDASHFPPHGHRHYCPINDHHLWGMENKQLCNDLRMKKDYDSDTKGRALPVIELLFTKTKVFYGQKHCFKPFLVYLFYHGKMRNG